jgi:hypothetical protein
MPTRPREPRGKYAADSKGQVRAHGRQDEENDACVIDGVVWSGDGFGIGGS